MGLFSHGFPSDKKSQDGPPPDYPAPPPITSAQSTMSHPGSSQGIFQPPHNQFGVSFACLLLSSSDKIRLIGFSPDAIPAVDEAISRVWVPGVQKKGAYDGGGYEWKMSGRPWYGQHSEAIPSRRLIAHVLHALSAIGWHLHFATDLSKKGWDKDTLFFRPAQPCQRYFFPVSFNMGDKVRLIDSPSVGITTAFQAAVSAWPLGIQDVREKEPGCLQMKLKGNPWYTSNGAEVNHARLLGCNILSAMDAQGFELVGSIDMSVGGSSNDSYGELDTWFFAEKMR